MIADFDAVEWVAVLIADGHDQAVHAVGFFFTRGVELREHGCHAAVAAGVADIDLAGRISWAVDDEFVGVWIVGRGGFQLLHVGAVAAFGHGVAAE